MVCAPFFSNFRILLDYAEPLSFIFYGTYFFHGFTYSSEMCTEQFFFMCIFWFIKLSLQWHLIFSVTYLFIFNDYFSLTDSQLQIDPFKISFSLFSLPNFWIFTYVFNLSVDVFVILIIVTLYLFDYSVILSS